MTRNLANTHKSSIQNHLYIFFPLQNVNLNWNTSILRAWMTLKNNSASPTEDSYNVLVILNRWPNIPSLWLTIASQSWIRSIPPINPLISRTCQLIPMRTSLNIWVANHALRSVTLYTRTVVTTQHEKLKTLNF